jgi:hypothetical protein
MKQLKLNVTDMDIEFAIPRDSKKCMLVEAAKRDYGDRFTKIVADKEQIALTDKKTQIRYTFQLSPIARAAVLAFDDGIHPKPFVTILRNPIVRSRRARVSPGVAKDGMKTPRLVGRSGRGTAGQMPTGQVGTTAERRMKMGRDRFFGKRVFAADIAKLREQLEMSVPA